MAIEGSSSIHLNKITRPHFSKSTEFACSPYATKLKMYSDIKQSKRSEKGLGLMSLIVPLTLCLSYLTMVTFEESTVPDQRIAAIADIGNTIKS